MRAAALAEIVVAVGDDIDHAVRAVGDTPALKGAAGHRAERGVLEQETDHGGLRVRAGEGEQADDGSGGKRGNQFHSLIGVMSFFGGD